MTNPELRKTENADEAADMFSKLPVDVMDIFISWMRAIVDRDNGKPIEEGADTLDFWIKRNNEK